MDNLLIVGDKLRQLEEQTGKRAELFIAPSRNGSGFYGAIRYTLNGFSERSYESSGITVAEVIAAIAQYIQEYSTGE